MRRYSKLHQPSDFYRVSSEFAAAGPAILRKNYLKVARAATIRANNLNELAAKAVTSKAQEKYLREAAEAMKIAAEMQRRAETTE